MNDVLDGVDEGVLVVDANWQVTLVNAAASALLPETAIEGEDVREAFPRSVDATFHDHFAGPDARPAAVTFEEYFPDIEQWLRVRTRTNGDGLVVYLRDVTADHEREDTIAAREAELTTLDGITDIIHEIIAALVGATTRDTIERTVCDHLAESDLYEFAWVGEREATSGRLTSRTVAGDPGDILEPILEASTDPEAAPERVSVETAEPCVVRQLATDDRVPEPVRRTAFAHGLQSGLAVPIVYGDTVYGVLGVYAAREDAFSERERTGFATLGETVGLAVNAARQRTLLHSDTVVELVFRTTDEGAALVATTDRLACSLDVEGTVPLDDHRVLEYLLVEDAAPEDVLEDLLNSEGVVDGRVVRDHENGGLLQAILSGHSPTLLLSDLGGTIRTASAESGVGRLVVEFPPDENVREVGDELTGTFPETELVAKRERERAIETPEDLRSGLTERLTEKQRRALRTAYLGDYFESPRGSTGEDVADTLDISSATLHYHLRAAQRKLLDIVFDEESAAHR